MNGLVLVLTLVPLLLACWVVLMKESRWSDDVAESVKFWRELDGVDGNGDR